MRRISGSQKKYIFPATGRSIVRSIKKISREQAFKLPEEALKARSVKKTMMK